MSTEPALTTDDADQLMAAFVDARTALDRLEALARSTCCPGCDPGGERASRIGAELLERFELERIDADFLLSSAADARAALTIVLADPPCVHSDEEKN